MLLLTFNSIRRNNLEICGISDDIPTDQLLEGKVNEIANTIDINTNKADIEACCRLKKMCIPCFHSHMLFILMPNC